MTGHDAIQELSKGLMYARLAEKKVLDLPLGELRTDILEYIRSVKYALEIVDKGYGLQLTNQKEQ